VQLRTDAVAVQPPLFDASEPGSTDMVSVGPLQRRQVAPAREFHVRCLPPPADALPAKRRALEHVLTAANARGWPVWIFQDSAMARP